MTDSHNDIKDIVLTLDDFKNSGWKDALGPPEEQRYSLMHRNLENAGIQALEEGRQEHGKALLLLSYACSMRLNPASNEPFKPAQGGPYSRAVVPGNFSESDMRFFAEIVNAEAMDNPLLKGRLADIVWIEKRPANIQHFQFAQTAIDSYRSIPLDAENWFHDGGHCWRRSVELSHRLKAGAGNRLNEIRDSLFQALESAETEDGSFAFFLAELLLSCRLKNGQATKAGNRMARMAKEFETKPNYNLARDYFRMASNLFEKSKNEAKSAEMTAAIAEVWVKQADARISVDESHLAAATFYINAFQVYREIRGSEYAKQNDVDKRIQEIRTLLNRSKEKFSDDMQTASVQINVADIVQFSRNAVSGKSRDEAMMAFATLGNALGNVKFGEFRKSAIEVIKRHSHFQLVSRHYLSSDGRLEATIPPVNLDDISPEAIDAVMLDEYDRYIRLFVFSGVEPALEVLHLEHRFNEAYFINLVRQASIVPMDRKWLYGRALAAGFDYDFAVAIHLLVPQIENIVRQLLKANRVQTTEISKDGIESEKGLSSLIKMPGSRQALGDDLHFQIRALFCERIGSNLRNVVAHGMLNDADAQSHRCAYAWWFALRLVACVELMKVPLETLIKDINESNLHDEADADDPVEHEAE